MSLIKLGQEQLSILANKLERRGISPSGGSSKTDYRMFYEAVSEMGLNVNRSGGPRAIPPDYSALGMKRKGGKPKKKEMDRYREVTNGGELGANGYVVQGLLFDNDLITDRFQASTFNLLTSLYDRYLGRSNDFNHSFDNKDAKARIIDLHIGVDPSTALHPDTPLDALRRLSPENPYATQYTALWADIAFPEVPGSDAIDRAKAGLINDISIAFMPDFSKMYCSICDQVMSRFWFFTYCETHGFPGGELDDGRKVIAILDGSTDAFTYGFVSDGAVKRAMIVNDSSAVDDSTSDEEATNAVVDVARPSSTGYQWTVAGPNVFRITGATINQLPAGLYKITKDFWDNNYFELTAPDVDSLIKLPNSAGAKVIAGIQKFWASEDLFKAKGHLFKRGVLLWGPPGGGKTSVVNQLSSDLIEKGGIVLWVSDPPLAVNALPELRKVEPTRPIICILEDIDEVTKKFSEHELLSLLDGENQVNNVVFIATTNYPEKLDARMINRPSRFDEIIRVGMPSAAARSTYIRSRLSAEDLPEAELKKWVGDTKGLSIAHIKELIVSVKCLGNQYEDTLLRLKNMGSNFDASDNMNECGNCSAMCQNCNGECDADCEHCMTEGCGPNCPDCIGSDPGME